jgi:hypothetical protein
MVQNEITPGPAGDHDGTAPAGHGPGAGHEGGTPAGAPPARVRLTGTVRLPAGIGDPWVLFTPRGEQAWAEGWAPRFPAAVADDTEPGTVFQTSHGGAETTWVVCDRSPGRSIRYARITPGQMAGTVTVTLGPVPAGTGPAGTGPAAAVTYDLTALSPAGAAHLTDFAHGYDAYLKDWEEAIATIPA